MINYAKLWKKWSGFRQIDYDDFVSLPFTKGKFMAKVDGMLGVMIYSHGKAVFQTTTGRTFDDLPVTDEYERLLSKAKIKDAIIPGELVAIKNGKILPFNQIQSIVKRFSEQKNKPLIYHFPVDIISLNGARVGFDQALPVLMQLFRHGKWIKEPKYIEGGLEEFRKLFSELMDRQGFDGVIARGILGKNYKVKFVKTVDLAVIGAGNMGMVSWPRKQISYLISAFMDKDGKFRVSSKIGGFNAQTRKMFYEYVMKNQLFEQDNDVYIRPKMVIEVEYYRSFITPMPRLAFTGTGYENLGKAPSVNFSNPMFLRIRDDKYINRFDIRLEQIPEFSY